MYDAYEQLLNDILVTFLTLINVPSVPSRWLRKA